MNTKNRAAAQGQSAKIGGLPLPASKLLSDDQYEHFQDQGYLVLPPSTETAELLQIGLLKARDYLPSWDSGRDAEVRSHFPSPHLRTGFSDGLLSFRGCSLQDRRRAGRLSSEQKNAFHGQRAILRGHRGEADLAILAEHQAFIGPVEQLLGSRLSLHNFSLANVYPGHTGDDQCFHSDLAGFSKEPLTAFQRGDCYVLAIMYLGDVDNDTAPLQVFPESHKHYLEVNAHIAGLLGEDKSRNHISNIRNYCELLPSFLKSPINLTGPAGTMILLNNTVLHNPTANTSESRVRSTLFCTYSRRDTPAPLKKYLASKNLLSAFQDAELVEAAFHDKSSVKLTAQKILKWPPMVARKVRQTLIAYRNRPMVAPQKPKNSGFINIGASTKRIHPWFASVDQAECANYRINFSESLSLPFEENSLKVVYSSHCLEHLLEESAIAIMKEVYRALEPGGTFRLVLPDAGLFFGAYERRDLHFFDWVRNKGAYVHDSWLRLIVRHFVDPVVDQYNDEELHALYTKLGYESMLDRLAAEIDREGDIKSRVWGHQSWWNTSKASNILSDIGFQDMSQSQFGRSKIRVMRDTRFFDSTKPHMSLFIEAKK